MVWYLLLRVKQGVISIVGADCSTLFHILLVVIAVLLWPVNQLE